MNFFRLHGGRVINLNQIVTMEFTPTGEALVYLSNGRTVRMGESELNELMPLIDSYFMRRK